MKNIGLKEVTQNYLQARLGQHLYDDLKEVQQEATRWLWTYNNERPHMGIGGITPQQKLERFFNTVST